MKAKDLRAKSIEELKSELLASLREQFNLNIQKGAGQPPNSNLLQKTKLDIARIKTILHEKGSRV